MKIKYLGHAAFKIVSDSGVSLITDPYTSGDQIKHGEINDTADVVTVSHEHYDHNNAASVRGKPRVVKGTAPVDVKGIRIKGIDTFHDEAKGSKRGKNVVYCLDVDGIRLCHLGDLGHEFSSAQIAEMGKVDILLIPVGGFYTIDAAVASRICDAVAPRVIVPMHFKTPKTDLPIAPVDDFLRGKKNITRLDGSETEFTKDKLPAATQIVALKPAL